jgi:hypothetical protein
MEFRGRRREIFLGEDWGIRKEERERKLIE